MNPAKSQGLSDLSDEAIPIIIAHVKIPHTTINQRIIPNFTSLSPNQIIKPF